MAWTSNWQYANVEPTVTWRGAQSVPRALTLRRGPDGLRLVQAPVAELEALRTTPQPTALSASGALPPSAEILLEVKPGDWREAGVRLSNSAGEEVIVGIARTPLEVFVDRRRSRRTTFHAEYPGRHAGPVAWRNGAITLRILFDRSVLEVFANDGETVVTDRVFPTQPLDRLELFPQSSHGPPRRCGRSVRSGPGPKRKPLSQRLGLTLGRQRSVQPGFGGGAIRAAPSATKYP